MLTGLLASFVTTLLWMIVCIFLMHCHPPSPRFKLMLRSFIFSLPFLGLFLFLLQHQSDLVEKLNGAEAPFLAYLIAFILHFLFFFFFVECFYHVERSVTLRLLIEIHESLTPLSVSTLMRDYSVNDMIKRRLENMLSSKWIYRENDQWRLTSKGLWLARIMHISCWIFQSKPQNKRL